MAAKRTLIEAELKDNPERSNRQVAVELGVNHETVIAARKKLEATGGIRQLDKTVGKDGKARTTTPARPAPPTVARIHTPGDDGKKPIRRYFGSVSACSR